MAEESKNALFVYTLDDSGRFWVYDGASYHRFLWRSEGLWFIRSQFYLPQCSYGKCLMMSDPQRADLQFEAGRHGIVLPFFATELECKSYAASVRQNQLVFDCTVPGGYFYTA